MVLLTDPNYQYIRTYIIIILEKTQYINVFNLESQILYTLQGVSNIANLLGLDSKFYTQPRTINNKVFYHVLERFKYNIRVRSYMLDYYRIIE